jgi:hypothetical protein
MKRAGDGNLREQADGAAQVKQTQAGHQALAP